MIDATAVSAIFGSLMGIWALGLGLGSSVAWVNRIKDAV